QTVDAPDDDHLTIDNREALLAKPAQGPIHMHMRETEVIRDLFLRERQVEAHRVEEPPMPEAFIDIEDHRGDASRCFKPCKRCSMLIGTPMQLSVQRKHV